MKNKNSIKKIILTGPESTGKTTLSAKLADFLNEPVLPEFARTYISQINRAYEEEDLLKIAEGQCLTEFNLSSGAKNFLVCDTSMLVLKVWSEYKYGRCHPFILEKLTAQKNDFFILCGIDIPWVADWQRENPNDRLELYNIYKKELSEGGFSFIEVEGGLEERLQTIIKNLPK